MSIKHFIKLQFIMKQIIHRQLNRPCFMHVLCFIHARSNKKECGTGRGV